MNGSWNAKISMRCFRLQLSISSNIQKHGAKHQLNTMIGCGCLTQSKTYCATVIYREDGCRYLFIFTQKKKRTHMIAGA